MPIAHAQQERQPGLLESLGKLLQPKQDGSVAEAASPSANPAVAGKARRVALVIGNSAYPGAGALRNPANDANDVAAKLKKLGFDVTVRTDMRHKDMLRSLTDFGDKVQSGTEALFFYAGHGMQVKGKNYLLPVDAEIRNEASASSEAVDVDQLLDKLSLARLSVVILDACRNNPFERRFRGSGQGLAQINAPTGTLIAYATAPGKVAADGDGRNGLYTAELLSAMDIPGIKIEDVFKRVRSNVVKKSNDAQTPWESSSLTGDFYFAFQGPTTINVQQMPADPEAETWIAAQGVNTEAGYQTYLDAYPNGRYALAAKIKLTDLKKPPTSQTKKTPVVVATPSPAIQEHGETKKDANIGHKKAEKADIEKASDLLINLFEIGMEQGNPSANQSTKAQLFGVLEEMNLSSLVKQSNEGNTAALIAQAQMYLHGKGALVDRQKFLELIELAANKGNAVGQLTLGALLANGGTEGLTVEKDLVAGFRWLLKAAEQGLRTAQALVGGQYILGAGVDKDSAEGGRWLKKAAEQGSRWAQYMTGRIILDGTSGVASDPHQAYAWFRKSADQGLREAQYVIGHYFMQGFEVVPKDIGEAFEWFKKSAEQGHKEAQYTVGLFYAEGKVVAVDDSLAVAWFRKAAFQGMQGAIKELEKRGVK